jgi:hypothetical protein
MTDRAVSKQLAGLEDLLLGTGTVNQVRSSGTLPITRIDASGLVYENTTSLRAKLYNKAEVVENIQELQTWPTNTARELYILVLGYTSVGDGGGGLFWLDRTDVTSSQDLSTVFNPDSLSSGRWKRVDLRQQITANVGDADSAITLRGTSKLLYATTLTANRTVSLPTVNLYKGFTARVVRTDTGAFTLAVGSVCTIPSGGKYWVEITYNGASWIQTAGGPLL